MLVKTDLHVHSVLSACADKDNTVNNIVNLGVLLDTRILALSDHNSCLNFPAFKQVCVANGILAVPAMEVTTAEEIHVLCLFKDYQDAKTLNDEIFDSLFPRHRHRAAGDLVETVRAGQKRTFAGMLIAA